MTGIFLFAPVLAEVNDPMRPPEFAMQKFRLEKLKKNPPKVVAAETQPPREPLVLNSILFSADRQHAIINSKLVKKGDRIRGARLVRLTPNSARLIDKGKIIDLELFKRHDSIRKSTPGRKQ